MADTTWTANLTRQVGLLASLLDNQHVPTIKCVVSEAFSLPKSSRRHQSENEDAFVHFSLANLHLVGVFDGHAGSKLARYLREHVGLIAKEIRLKIGGALANGDAVGCITGLFPEQSRAAFEQRWLEISEFSDPLIFFGWLILAVAEERAMADPAVDTATAGSCVSLVLVDLVRAKLAACWLGDAAITLQTSGPSGLKFRSVDHRVACSPHERSRVESCGGRIFKNRAIGVEWSNLGVTRALGDTIWKPGNLWTRDLSAGQTGRPILDEELVQFSRARGCTGVSGTPDLQMVCCAPGDLLIVASDGFWDLRLSGLPPFRETIGNLHSVLHDDTTAVVLELRPTAQPSLPSS